MHILSRGSLTGFKQSSANGYGGEVAAFYGLDLSHSLTSESVAKQLGDAAWRKKNAGVYYFDVRKGKAGHVGFLVIREGDVRQVHFSGLKAFNGLADNTDFLDTFLKASKYKKEAKITLYKVVRIKKK